MKVSHPAPQGYCTFYSLYFTFFSALSLFRVLSIVYGRSPKAGRAGWGVGPDPLLARVQKRWNVGGGISGDSASFTSLHLGKKKILWFNAYFSLFSYYLFLFLFQMHSSSVLAASLALLALVDISSACFASGVCGGGCAPPPPSPVCSGGCGSGSVQNTFVSSPSALVHAPIYFYNTT